MINFKELFETVYEPRSGDEKNFKDKHVIMKIKTPYDTESQFTSGKAKAKRKADYDEGDDEAVYEAADVHTKRADKEPVIVRTIDPKTGQGKTKTVLKRAGEIKVEEVELGEKVVNPYAVGMAAAMKATGDRPPLKKSTIMKGHEIAKSIKKEAMDPVGKEDGDIDNDGDVDKSDKYLKNRRKAIRRALQKEDTSIDQENSTYNTYKKSNKPNPIKKNAEDAVKESTQLDELSPNTLHRYIKKATPEVAARAISAVAPNQSDETKKHASKLGKRIAGITSASGRLSDKANAMHEASAEKLKSYIRKARDERDYPTPGKPTKDRSAGVGMAGKKVWEIGGKAKVKATSEEVEQIDELKKSTLASYVKKATRSAATSLSTSGKEVAKPAAKRNELLAHSAANKYLKRSAGISLAVDKLAKEETEHLDEAFKVGSMKLHDGSTVTLTRESVDALNGLFNQLNGSNKAKMEERMMSGKKGFQEILSFAENI